MKISPLKKPNYYIRNLDINQMNRPKNQNILNSIYSENTKNITDNNIKQNIKFNPKKIFFNKKTVYQNYSNKSKLIKSNSNLNIHNTKYYNEKPVSLGVMTDSIISGRKINQNNYEIVNPFKESRDFDNENNYFNKTYAYFNNKNHQNCSNKSKPNYSNKQEDKKMEKLSMNLSVLSYQNIPNQLYNYNNSNDIDSHSNNNSRSPIKKENNYKKYFYQENIMNNKNNYMNENNNTSYNKLNKKSISPIMTPIIVKNNNNTCITSPKSKYRIKNNNEQNGRIKRYILNNLSDKRKIKSRQYFRQYLYPSSKSSGINNDNFLNYDKNINFNSPFIKKVENKFIENASILNSPSLPSFSSNLEDISNTISTKKNYIWMKKSNSNLYSFKNNNNKINQNIINLRNELSSNLNNEESYSNLNINEKNGINEKEVKELSAIFIQSVFRGYLVRGKLETYLYNFKIYNKGFEKIIKIFNSFLDKDINQNIIEIKKKFMKNLKMPNFSKNISDITSKSYKTLKMSNFLPYSSLNEIDIQHKLRYMDLFLHKEIGERFSIIKENKENELIKKLKEELDGLHNKMNKLIEENNLLKDINNKNKYNESKFEELLMENKKKDNIINIITNDNQNLAKKLKNIKDKSNKFEMHNETSINFCSENNQYKKFKELSTQYRNLYLLFLIHKKDVYLCNILRKYFDKFRNTVKEINYNNNNIILFKKQKLINIIKTKSIKEHNYLKYFFMKYYLIGLIKNKEKENKNTIIKSKLINIIINREKYNKYILKSSFDKFLYKGMISNLIDEKNKYIIDKNKENNEKFKKLLIKIDNRKDKHNFLIIRDCFDKWNLLSKILGMKAITDEKKRKKRQKQRMKKKIGNQSANKYTTNNNNFLNLGKNNNINIINKDKDILYLENCVTTDFSGGDINGENKNDKIIKATVKLGEIFYKAAKHYKSLDNKNNTITKEKEINETEIKEKKNEKEIKENNENDNEYEEDSGDSFGI